MKRELIGSYKGCVETAVEFPLSAYVIKTRAEKYAWTLLSSSSTVLDHFFTSSKFNASNLKISNFTNFRNTIVNDLSNKFSMSKDDNNGTF